MSSIFDSEEGSSVFSEPLGTCHRYGPFQVAYEMVHHIMEKTYNRIDRKQVFR